MKNFKNHITQKILIIGSIFLLFGSSFFGTIQLGVEHTSTGEWYSWQIHTAEAREDDDEEEEEYEDDEYEHRNNISKSVSDSVIIDDELNGILEYILEDTPTTKISPIASPVSQQKSTPTPIASSPKKSKSIQTVSIVNNTPENSNEETFSPISLVFTPNGNIFTVNMSTKGAYSYNDNLLIFSSKSDLLKHIIQQSHSSTLKKQEAINIISQDDNIELTQAIEIAEKKVMILTGKTTGASYIERPFFDKKILAKKTEVNQLEEQKTPIKTPVVPVVVKKVTPPQAPVTKPTPPVQVPAETPKTLPPVAKKDACVNGDYTGNLYDGKCGTKPKDSCPNGDYTGNLYDGACGSKPKDTCPNGDYTGNLYDGACGTKPKDTCPNGDYTGDLYDGTCGSKPKDKCVKDYSGDLYDGTCGTKPDTNTRAS